MLDRAIDWGVVRYVAFRSRQRVQRFLDAASHAFLVAFVLMLAFIASGPFIGIVF